MCAPRIGTFGQHQPYVDASQRSCLERLIHAFGRQEVRRLDIEVLFGICDAEDNRLKQGTPWAGGATGNDLQDIIAEDGFAGIVVFTFDQLLAGHIPAGDRKSVV